ncbi:MAG: DUF4198 domain-containing protein [Lautropia sp.]|nr:DUF4198 domain-containing protein [Lautropia sp.]
MAIGATLCSTTALAHDVWLMPSSTVLSKADWITVDAAVSNDLFHFNHAPLRLDNLQVTAPDGSKLSPENAQQGKLRSVFDLNLKQSGTYRIAVTHEGLSARWEEDGKRKRWRGKVADFDKAVPAHPAKLEVTDGLSRVETYVTVGKPGQQAAPSRGLAYVPVTHPNDWVVDEATVLSFTLDGQPIEGLEVVAMPGNSRYRDTPIEIKGVTDATGKVSLQWPAAGMYWVHASHQDQKTSHPKSKERRLSYSGTFEVLP